MVMVASRGRWWCWWLAGVVSCGTATSVVLVASRGRRWCWWLAGSSVVVPGVGGVGGWPSSSGLSSALQMPSGAAGPTAWRCRPLSSCDVTKSSRSCIDKRTAWATGNTRYRYSKIAPLDHKMADNCVSLARTNTLSSTIFQ